MRGHRETGPIDIVNLTNTLSGLEHGHFLPIGLSSCYSSFILNDDLGTTACLSDLNIGHLHVHV